MVVHRSVSEGREPSVELIDIVTLDRLAVLGEGIARIGGSADDDVTVDGLPPVAAVIDVDRRGAAVVRRADGVDGGDSDPFFGSPTAGRALRFGSADVAAGAATFRLNGRLLAMRRLRSSSGGDRRAHNSGQDGLR